MAYKFVNADQLDTDLTTVANAIRAKGNTSEQLVFPSGMVSAISAISTGVELNFEVVGNPQPANPKENTIWLNTDVDITGQYLQAEQPEGMAEGEVWISTGTESQVAFNALKKGTIMVYPLAAKQMQSGTLVDVTATSWQDGAWVEWDTRFFIFKEGEGVTDGYAIKYKSGPQSGFAISSDKITWATDVTSGDTLWVNPTVDLASYEYLCFELTCTNRYSSSNVVNIGVGSNIPTSVTDIGALDASIRNIYDTTRKTYQVPISNVSGERYIKFNGFGVTGYIHNIWLE